MKQLFSGQCKKLAAEYSDPVRYCLGEIELNQFIGQEIHLEFSGKIFCIHCGRVIKKSFGQGYCFPCFSTLARCDSCIVKPELCHFSKGTCREPEWGRKNCLIEHSIYLANSSSIKIGITRSHQKITRWIDQGANSAIEIARVSERLLAGLAEVNLKEGYSDRTDWRGLLTGNDNAYDLEAEKNLILEDYSLAFEEANAEVVDSKTITINYPVISYLEKAKTANLEKDANLSGEFKGIRGQYLLIGESGLNMRKYQGYEITLSLVGI